MLECQLNERTTITYGMNNAHRHRRQKDDEHKGENVEGRCHCPHSPSPLKNFNKFNKTKRIPTDLLRWRSQKTRSTNLQSPSLLDGNGIIWGPPKTVMFLTGIYTIKMMSLE